MVSPASREIADVLGAFLRRTTSAGDDVDARMHNIAAGNARASASPFVLPDADAPVGFPEGALAAIDLPPADVRARLAQLTEYVAAQVNAGELPGIDLPDLHRVNTIFDARGNVFLGRGARPLAFDARGSKAFVRLLLTIEAANDNLRNGVCTTKRGLFYRHQAELHDDACQVETDRALVSLANVLRVRRRALGFVEIRRGSVHGRLVVRDGAQVVDLAQVGPGGRGAPRFIDDVEIISSDAKVIVIVEKDAIAAKLAQARFCDTARCILVSGHGFPSMSTREFVRKLIDTLGIPAVAFVDGDPAGIQLAITYAHGAISTALETPWLACNEIRWAGLVPSEIDRHCGIRDMIRLGARDIEKARELLEHPSSTYVNARVRKELESLLDRGSKVELDALTNGPTRLVDYLQHKLSDGDLIAL